METLLLIVGIPILALGVAKWVIMPLAMLFELRGPATPALSSPVPKVSVIVPAYNEEVVLAGCLSSILASGYPRLELIVVDDGSTDGTAAVMEQFRADPRTTLITQPNGGKGSALNTGIKTASGEILIFVDADGLFTTNTIPELLKGFRHRRVGAVCGNDKPVNLDRPMTHLLALMTHVGTGLTRRALALVGVLPIVAGNSGAFRADVVRRLGGFRTDTLGEDLELTWRVQLAGYDVEFTPHAQVLAEVPSTLGGLWRQRVRWARGLIQTARIHRRAVLLPGRLIFRWYLPVNLISMLVIPVLQLALWVVFPVAVMTSGLPWQGVLGFLAYVSLGTGLLATVLAISLDRAWRDLRLLYVLPLWLPYSIYLNLVTVRAIWLEAVGATQAWNKLERSGVQSEIVVQRVPGLAERSVA